MHEYTWWYLYVQIQNYENERRKEVYQIIESLLPWMNLEMWQELQKQKDKGRENIDFENQFRAMMDGTWSTDPNDIQMPRVDDLESSRTAGQMFNQAAGGSPSTIRDTLFPDKPPTFKGGSGDIPSEYRDFYKNMPDVTEFPPEEE